MNKINYKISSILHKFNSGKKESALNEINILLSSDVKNIDLIFAKTKMLISLNQIDEANQSLEKILDLEPKNTIALELIYSNYLKINNIQVAEKYINKLININHHKYETIRDKAFIEYLKANYQNAEKFIEKAIQINGEDVFGLNIYGLIKIEQDKTLEAISLFKKAISINPKYADSFNNLGKCFIDIENLNHAYMCFKKAYRINSESELPLINIANILSLKDKNKLALKFYEMAKKINPQNHITIANIAIINCKIKNIEWVEKKFQNQKALEKLNPDFVLGYSYLLLNKKRFSEAFDLFDARLETKDFPKKNIYHLNIIKKLNTNRKIKTDSKILVIKEQGVGDEILFSSIYYDLLQKHNNVTIECDPRLLEIFNRSFKKNIFFPFGHFSSAINKMENFDKILYSGSLTKFFRKNESDFNISPYLKSLKEVDNHIGKKLAKFKNTKKIGISWKSVVNIYGSLKSLKIKDFEKINSSNALFINLQYGKTEEDINNFRKNGKKIYTFNDIDLFNDFDALISILKQLDVFVTVSNSTAHFAGALGIPTILICPKKSSTYYYWDYENGKTPWYKSISIVKFEDSIENTMIEVNDLIDKI